MELTALRSFRIDKATLVRAGERFEEANPGKAAYYQRMNLATADAEAAQAVEAQREAPKPRTQQAPKRRTQAVPSAAAGETKPSSASRAAQVSPPTTARKSATGKRKRKVAE